MSDARELMGRFVRTPEAGRLLGLSGRTLEKHRTCGTGPICRKLGGRVVYALSGLRAWADLDIRSSTTQSAGSSRAGHPAAETRQGFYAAPLSGRPQHKLGDPSGLESR